MRDIGKFAVAGGLLALLLWAVIYFLTKETPPPYDEPTTDISDTTEIPQEPYQGDVQADVKG